MIFRKNFLLLTLLLIIILQILLYTNNNQKTSFKYLKWTIQDVSIGKLISISFFSGLFISTLLNITVNYPKNNNSDNFEENNEPLDDVVDVNSSIEMPPQRDIRDAQPTISVNYRVIKSMEENNLNRDKNNSNIPDKKDDWDNDDNDW